MAGPEQAGNIADQFNKFAEGGDPIQAQMLANAPLSQWPSIVEKHGPPANPEEFKTNLINQIGQNMQRYGERGIKNTEHQASRVARGFGDARPSGATGVEQEIYDRGIAAAKDLYAAKGGEPIMDAAGIKGFVEEVNVGGVIEGVAQDYQSAIDGLEFLYMPEPEVGTEAGADVATAQDMEVADPQQTPLAGPG